MTVHTRFSIRYAIGVNYRRGVYIYIYIRILQFSKPNDFVYESTNP